MRRIFYFFIFLLFSCNTDSLRQEEKILLVEDVLTLVYNQDIEKAAALVNTIDDPLYKNALQLQVEQFTKEEVNFTLPSNTDESSFSTLDHFLINLTKGDLLQFNDVDSLAFVYYKNAESHVVQLESRPLEREIYSRITRLVATMDGVESKDELFNTYLEKYRNVIESPDQDFYYLYMLAISEIYDYKLYQKMPGEQSALDKMAGVDFKDPFFEGGYFLMRGVQNNLIHKDYEQSLKNGEQALQLFKKSSLAKARIEEAKILINIGGKYLKLGEYNQSLSSYNQALQIVGDSRSLLYMKKYIYRGSAACYDSLNQNEKARAYLMLESRVKDTIKEMEAIKNIHFKNSEFNFQEKEKEIKDLSQSKNFFQRNFFFLLPLALALAFFTFLFRKRYKTSNTEKELIQHEYETSLQEKEELQTDLDSISEKIQALENEKAQTIERLKELKEVVTKDFIILQDKSKVYIEELMFIKSDDHYLRVHLHEKKDNFVRGKLSTIIKDLPPNFKRCHRSYIVNENYIEKFDSKTLTLIDGSEVPVSKSYKDQF